MSKIMTKNYSFSAHAFVVVIQPHTPSSLLLHAKKNKKKRTNTSGQGFGSNFNSNNNPASIDTASSSAESTVTGESQTFMPLQSEISTTSTVSSISNNGNVSVEERNKEILKEKFGLRSYEEQVGDLKAAENIAKNKSRMQKWKDMKDEEFDIFQVIPTPVLNAIDTFLKTGLGITTTLFILAGFGITAEAWSAATHNELPPGWDDFIVTTVEPNFTTGLLVLLSFSVSLGIFASAQLGSSSSIYTED